MNKSTLKFCFALIITYSAYSAGPAMSMNEEQLRQFVNTYYQKILWQEKKLLEGELSQLVADLEALEQVGSALRNQKTKNSFATFALLAASPSLLRTLVTMFQAPSMVQAVMAAKREALVGVIAAAIIAWALEFKYRDGEEQAKLLRQLEQLQGKVGRELQKLSLKYQVVMEGLVGIGDTQARKEYQLQLQESIRNIEALTGVLAATATKYSGAVFTERYLYPIFGIFIGPRFARELVTDASLVKNRPVGWIGGTAVWVASITTLAISANRNFAQADTDQELLALLEQAKAQLQGQLEKLSGQF